MSRNSNQSYRSTTTDELQRRTGIDHSHQSSPSSTSGSVERYYAGPPAGVQQLSRSELRAMGPLSLGSSGRSSSRSGGVSQQGSGRSQLSGGGSQGSSSARSVRSLDLSESAFMQYQSDAGSGGGGGFVASDPLRRGTGAGRGSATSRVSGGGSRDTTMSRGELSPEGRDRVERWRSGISGSRRFS